MGINRGNELSTFSTLAIDVSDSGLIYESSSNEVGIGVADPGAQLEVFKAGTQLMLSYDADSFATLAVADASHLTISTAETGNLILDAAGDIELNADGADIVFKDGSATIGKFSSTSVLGMTLGAGVAEDIMIAFDGNAQDFRIGIDDGTDTLEIGHGIAHGTNTALAVDSSGQITTFNIPAAAVAQASDHIIFLDGGAGGAPKAESIDDFLTAIAGSGISVSSSQLTASGGGASALNDLSDVSFSGGDLLVTGLDLLTTSASAHNAAGTAVVIEGGSTTAGTTNNIAGGSLTLAGGKGKGSGAGGDIIFQVANAGGSGSSLNSLATALTISDDKSAEFESTIAGRTSMTILNTTTSSATQGGKLTLTCDDGAAMADDHRLGIIEFTGAEDSSNSLTIGATIEALCDAGWSSSENGGRLVFSTTDGNANVSEVLRLDSDKLATFAGGVTVTGDVTLPNTVLCGKWLRHDGDIDTQIVFFNGGDTIAVEAGGIDILRCVEDGANSVCLVNAGANANLDFRVNSQTETHMLFVDSGNNRISIGDSVDAPAATLEITNHATAGAFGVPLLQLNSNDVDKIALDVNAANTTAEVINVTADALTTAGIMKLVSDSSSTATRTLVELVNDNAAATDTVLMKLQNDAITPAASLIVESSANDSSALVDLINTYNAADRPPVLKFTKINGAADDYNIGTISFNGENDVETPEPIEYAKITAIASDIEDGDEGGLIQFSAMAGGTAGTGAMTNFMNIGLEDADSFPAMVQINPDAGDIDFQVRSPTNNNLLRCNAGDHNVGIGNQPTQASAVLEVTSTTAGFLPPRMTTTQQNAIGSPASGLVLYNTSTNKLMVWNGSAWTALH